MDQSARQWLVIGPRCRDRWLTSAERRPIFLPMKRTQGAAPPKCWAVVLATRSVRNSRNIAAALITAERILSDPKADWSVFLLFFSFLADLYSSVSCASPVLHLPQSNLDDDDYKPMIMRPISNLHARPSLKRLLIPANYKSTGHC